MENKKNDEGRKVAISAVISVASGLFSIGKGIYDLYATQRSDNEDKIRYNEQLKWQKTISSNIAKIQTSLVDIGDSLLDLSKVIVDGNTAVIESVKKEFENYVANCLIASIRTIAAQYSEWKEVLEGNDDVKKKYVIDTIVNKKQVLFQKSALAFQYSYSCCNSMALALSTIISLCYLINDKTGLNGIITEFENYFKFCLDSSNPKSIPSEYKKNSQGSNKTNDEWWHSVALVQARTNIEKYLIAIECIKKPGIQISVNYGIIRVGEYPYQGDVIDFHKYKPYMTGSRVEVNILGNDLGGEIITSNVKVIRVIAIDTNNSNSIFYDKTFYEDTDWEGLCNTALDRVNNIDFNGKLVLVIISGAHAYQYPTDKFAAWLRKVGAKLEDWRTQTNASGPSDAICYFYLGKFNEKPMPVAEKFAVNWEPGKYYSYMNLESYMLRINYSYPLK